MATIKTALLLAILLCFSCKKVTLNKAISKNTNNITSRNLKDFKKKLPENFKAYWYAGKAEITSYKLEQARYGEIRNGHATLIFVTEDFLPEVQVKADQSHPDNISVLKLNTTKKFNTGIYPYSVMQSTFYPVSNDKHAIKISSSMQEWCGHVYAQLNNREHFEITSHSYFQGEADNSFKLRKTILENELWTQLRISPKSLPTGNLQMIPAFEYIRLRHIAFKAYNATAKLTKNTYTIFYPELKRTLTITFSPEFPYTIQNWEETFKSGFGANTKILTTKATKLKTIKSDYWHKNQNIHEALRDSLFLK